MHRFPEIIILSFEYECMWYGFRAGQGDVGSIGEAPGCIVERDVGTEDVGIGNIG